jgi:predicted O-methyltransferase YrrM
MKKYFKELEKQAIAHGLPIVGPEKGKVLADAVKKHKPKHILEIGTNVGYSAILMSLNFKGRITTIEINPEIAKIARDNISKAGLLDRINVVVGPALISIPELEETYDMIFLDAVKEEYYDYVKAAEPKLSDKAVIVADNVGVFEEEMQNFLHYVRRSGKYISSTYDFGYDAVEVSQAVA